MASRFISSNGGLLHVESEGYGSGSHPGRGVAFHTDGTDPGPWEQFSIEDQGGGAVAIRTHTGNLVTAVNAGGMNAGSWSPLATRGSENSYRSLFDIIDLGGGKVALRTVGGHLLTALNGGGYAEAPNHEPLHTDATIIGPWELFKRVEIAKKPSSPSWIANRSFQIAAKRVGSIHNGLQPWTVDVTHVFNETIDKVRLVHSAGPVFGILVRVGSAIQPFPALDQITGEFYGEEAFIHVSGLQQVPVGEDPFAGVLEYMAL